MSIQAMLFRYGAGKSDKKRDAAIPLPSGVTECRNISYGPYGNASLLDVYYPEGTTAPLPTIVSIHGGGYVYGSKEIYRRYGMDMARRGFAFVNFNYRLAPKWRFPTPLGDTNSVMEWICKNAARYHLDPSRIILLGDSAGAQLTSQYAAIEALRNCDEEVEKMVAEYDKRRRYIVDRFRAMGLSCFEPLGAFCVFPSIEKTGLTSEEFCQGLLRSQAVACVPGTAFGESGEGFIRASYCYSTEHILEALRRIEKFLNSL